MLEFIGIFMICLIIFNILAVGAWVAFCEAKNFQAKRKDKAIFKVVEEFHRELSRVVETS